MAGKNNSESQGLFSRVKTAVGWGPTPKAEDTTPKNDTVTSQQPSSTASKPIHGATKPIPGAFHEQPALSSTPRRPTKVLNLDSSGLVTDRSKKLGHGSFGRVYAGTYDGNDCAVKIFEANTKLQKIEKEAEVSFLLTHNNLVQVYGLCRKDSNDCLVMERCTMNLTAYLERQRGHQLQYSVKLKLSILHQITQGMLYLHLNEIVHGDLSPGNVLLLLEGPAESSSTFIVKIADFGQSRLLNTSKNKQLTSTHGKDDFMPPEVLTASKEKYPISKSVDLFSFGCLVPYVATCTYPDPKVQLAVKGSSELQKRIRHIQNCVPALEPPEFKAACEDLMTKCLSKNPVDRPSFQHISAVLGPLVKIYVDQGYSATEEEKTTEIVKLNEELQSKKDWCDQLQKEKDNTERAYVEFQRDYQDLETKCQDKTEKIAELQKEMNSLQMEVATKEASLKTYSGLGIGTVVGDTQKLQKERDDAVRGMEYAEERNAELEVQCQGLQEQVDGLKCELNQTTSMKTNLEQKKTKLAGEKNSLQGKLQIVEKALETSSLECAQLKQKVFQLNSEVLTITTSRNGFQTSCQILAKKKKELEGSSRTTEYELAASRRKVEEHEITISDQRRKLKNETQNLHSETSAKNVAVGSVTRLDTLCKKQEAELVRLKKEVDQLKTKKFDLVNNLSAETEAKEALQKNVKKLEEENIKAEKEIGRMTNIVDYVKKESKTKDEDYEKLDRQYKEVAENGKESTIQLTVKLKDAEASHEKAMAMHHTATKEKEKLSRKVEELKRKKVELTKTVASNEVEIKEKQEEIESLKVSHEKSCDENSTLDTEKKRLTEELAAAETDRDALIESEANNKTIIRSKTRTINQQFAQLDSVMEERKELEMMNTRAEAFLQQCDEQCESMKEDLEELRGLLEKARKTEKLTSQWTEIKDQTIKEFNERNMFLQRECHRLEKEALSRHAETASKSELQVQQLKQEHEHLKATHSQCEELGRKKRSLDKKEKKIQRQKEANMKEVVQILRKDQLAANNLGDTSFSKESLDHMRREVTEEVVTAMKDQQELALEKMKRELKATVEDKQGRIQQMETELRYSEAAYRQLESKLKSLAERFFCAQRYPFFLHNMQVAGIPELEHQTQQFFKSDVSISDVEVLGQGFTFVKSVLDLPDAAINDLFKAVQKATREKLHLALSATFYNFKGKSKMITFHRFHIISVSCILVRAEWSGDVGRVQPTPLYLHASVDIDNACLLHSTPHAESLGIGGLYYLTQMQGQKEQFKQLQALSLGALVVKKETGTVHEISKYLDRKLYTHTVEKYSSLASPSVDVPKVQVKKMATR